MKRIASLGAACLLAAGLASLAREIGFLETYSLASDRREALRALIPGTEDFYYFTCLEAQTAGRFETVAATLPVWIARFGHTARVTEIQNRQALLDYTATPDATLAYLRRELGLTFDHRPARPDREPDLPTRLDPVRIGEAALTRAAFDRYRNLEGIEDAGLDGLAQADLDPDRRRDLLRRLRRPDLPDLAKRVVEDLRRPASGGFGSLPIHTGLLLDQLEAVAAQMPELLGQTAFVEAVIARLVPGADADPRPDAPAWPAYRERLLAFTRRLPPAFNSLKAHSLYQALDADRRAGRYDRERFLAYLQLPRRVRYLHPAFAGRPENRGALADLKADFRTLTGFPPVGDDEPLVREYLAHFLRDAADAEAFAPYLEDGYLNRLFAETKLVAGIGDPEQWIARLPPDAYQALLERVDLEFVSANPRVVAAAAPVSLQIDTKNIPTLIVKVFALNAFAYYQARGEAIDPALDLDGLVPTEQQVATYDDPPLRRVRRTFAFPLCDKPGVYAIEFIGNGRCIRALIQKGQLHAAETIGPAGHEFTVFDEENRPCPTATLWLAGREYRPDADGVITVPFTAEPGPAQAILRDGDRCSRWPFRHREETYALQAGFYVDREALLGGSTARLLVRPALTLQSEPVSLALLESVRLTLEAVDADGIVTRQEKPEFALSEARESVCEFPVPDRLARLRVRLSARVRNVSRQREETLAAEQAFTLNTLEAEAAVEMLLFRRTAAGYAIELRGKNGEPKTGRPIRLELKHRGFRDPVRAALQTDADGAVHLGALEGLEWVRASGPDGAARTWRLAPDEATIPASVHGLAGGVLKLPVLDTGAPLWRQAALFERRGGVAVSNRLDAARFRDGFLEIAGLPAGDYDLHLKMLDRRVTLRLADGTASAGRFLSAARTLDRRPVEPLQIASVQANAAQLVVTLAHATPFTRLHVLATRYWPAYAVQERLAGPVPEPAVQERTPPESGYLAGRDIGDEHRYVLDRQYARKFPGVQLPRPGLLLAPWSVNKTETGEAELAEAGDFAPRAPAMEAGRPRRARGGHPEPPPPEDGVNLDFLGEAAAVRVNLKPDADGVVRLDRRELGNHALVRLVAVDPLAVAVRSLVLADTPPALRDLRLPAALEAGRAFVEQKRVEALPAGGVRRFPDRATAEYQVYDSLGKVHGLLATLSGEAALADFAFLMRWPEWTRAEQEAYYSDKACHELNFFLYQKDRPFFEAVVQPFLRNKKDKTFLDRWLLGEDLAAYAEPWAFDRLTILERILLARRGVVAADGVARHVRELAELTSPDPDDFDRRLDTALRGAALEPADEGRNAMAAPVESPAPGPVMAEALASAPAALRATAEGRKSGSDRMAADAAKGAGASFFKARAETRRKMAVLYRQADPTEEWAESRYYRLPPDVPETDRVEASSFWADYAAHDGQTPFLSSHFLYADRTFTEAMMALAVLDLPFQPAAHTASLQGVSRTLQAGSPLLLVSREIGESAPVSDPPPLLVRQNYFRVDDRYRFEGNERVDAFVTGPFQSRTAYGCQVVLVNPSPARRVLRLLAQIPQGAVPLQGGAATRSVPVTLEPYATRMIETLFYFPEPGRFPHYPAQVAQGGRVAASADPGTLEVVETLPAGDADSWPRVSQEAASEVVLDYLARHNLHRLDLDALAWRLKDRSFYDALLALLRRRHLYQETLWSYGLYHRDPQAIREYLSHADFADRCGLWLDSPLLRLDPVARNRYQHLEYAPLIHARAHALGKRRQILNDRLYEQYQRFLAFLSCRPTLDDRDRLAVVYYLLLQDRVEEALAFFTAIDPAALEEKIQYDYLALVLDFYGGATARARTRAEPYRDYPVPRWRALFAEALRQLDEGEGRAPAAAAGDDRASAQAEAAAAAPGLELRVDARRITVDYQNLTSCRIHYYPMDIELLFSRNPFVQQQSGQFAFVQPQETQELALPAGQTRVTIDLPRRYFSRNVMIDVTGGGLRRTAAYCANALAVQVIEPYGQLRVTHDATGKPLAGVYVKAYARGPDGTVRFYKDGYTDLRGRFDYATLQAGEPGGVERFALLILSEADGAVIREAAPPNR